MLPLLSQGVIPRQIFIFHKIFNHFPSASPQKNSPKLIPPAQLSTTAAAASSTVMVLILLSTRQRFHAKNTRGRRGKPFWPENAEWKLGQTTPGVVILLQGER